MTDNQRSQVLHISTGSLFMSATTTPMTYKAFFNHVRMPGGQQVNPIHPHSISMKAIDQQLKLHNTNKMNKIEQHMLVQRLVFCIKNHWSVSSSHTIQRLTLITIVNPLYNHIKIIQEYGT